MTDPVLALSRRQVARRLATRMETIGALVRRGLIREVPWGNRRRIPLAEVERLALEGWTLDAPRARRRLESKAQKDPAAAIRAIDLDELGERT